jgi:uncharacterized protein
VSTQPAQQWRDTLRDALLTARKERDATRISALRCALSAIDNAEVPDDAGVDAPSGGTIAGSVVGLGAAEVARRVLSDDEIRRLLRAEVDERLTVAAAIDAGHPQHAASLQSEAAVLAKLLGDV